ncbi:MAG: hypothetical protein IK078_04370 [Lachnospiraceae bacterium]|nr:hypothetical protein [Lachnospiraceae bacterium]
MNNENYQGPDSGGGRGNGNNGNNNKNGNGGMALREGRAFSCCLWRR